MTNMLCDIIQTCAKCVESMSTNIGLKLNVQPSLTCLNFIWQLLAVSRFMACCRCVPADRGNGTAGCLEWQQQEAAGGQAAFTAGAAPDRVHENGWPCYRLVNTQMLVHCMMESLRDVWHLRCRFHTDHYSLPATALTLHWQSVLELMLSTSCLLRKRTSR